MNTHTIGTFSALLTALTILILCQIQLLAEVQPSGGKSEQTLIPGSNVNITWTNDLATAHVNISLWDGELGVETPVQTGVIAAQGTYAWTIPVTVHVGKKYRFVVRDAANPLRAMFSAGFVSIGSTPGPVVAGISEESKLQKLTISPQPAKENVRIQWPTGAAATITILNLQGGVVFSTSVGANQTEHVIDVESFVAGTYVVRLQTQGYVIAQDIIVVSP